MCRLPDEETVFEILDGTYVEYDESGKPERPTFIRCSNSLTPDEVTELQVLVAAPDPDKEPGLVGIYTQTQPLRIYPAGPLVASVLGFLVPDSPSYRHPAYLVYPLASDSPVLEGAVTALRELAADLG